MKSFWSGIKQKWLYSLVGLWISFKEEKSMLTLVVISLILIGIGYAVKLNAIEWAVTILSLFLSLIVEVINTAIEATVDTISFQYNVKVKKIKDIASAATLLMTLASASVICIIYINKIIEMVG